MIELLKFQSWSDSEVVFAVDWELVKEKLSYYKPHLNKLEEFLEAIAQEAVVETIGNEYNSWGTYSYLHKRYGNFVDGTCGIVFVSIELPDLDLQLTERKTIEALPSAPTRPEW
jgi:hypothetical protein